jgi:hypothetical protein
MRMDVVIPVVFPDFKILVEIPPTEVDVFPAWTWDNVRVPGHKDRYENLGHAGVLIVNGKTGLTKYYEYGRYDPKGVGLVRKIDLPDAKVDKGKVNLASLKPVLDKISRVAGQNGRVWGVYMEVDGKFDAMVQYAELRKNENIMPNRRPYSLTNNSCLHFSKEVTRRGGVGMPWLIDPRPVVYIGKLRDEFPDLDYGAGAGVLTIEGKGSFR